MSMVIIILQKYGVGVTDFSIGFGKEIFGWNDKSGTRWKVCWIPLGGYVKFFGDRNVYSQADQEEILQKYSKEEQDKLFTLKPLYQRALIVFWWSISQFYFSVCYLFQFMLLSEKILHLQLLMKFKKIVLLCLVVLKEILF